MMRVYNLKFDWHGGDPEGMDNGTPARAAEESQSLRHRCRLCARKSSLKKRRDSLVKQGLTTEHGKLRKSNSESQLDLKRLELEDLNYQAEIDTELPTHIASLGDGSTSWASMMDHDGYHDDETQRFQEPDKNAFPTRRLTAPL
eukprot:CFRG5271T1